MKRALLAVAVLGSLTFGAMSYAFPPTVTRIVTVTRADYRTRVITQWKTKTSTVTVHDGESVPCSEVSSGASGQTFLVLGNLQAQGFNGTYEGMCSVVVSPVSGSVSNGTVALTDAAGFTSTYSLGAPR